MKSFNGDKKLKKELLAEVIKHRKADAIIQRTYGTTKDGEWKGCAVGCAIHSLNIIGKKNWSTSDHGVYERELGIPRVLARLEDRIFEGLSVEESKTFPEKFISAIPVNVDLSMVWPKFIVWLLGDKKTGVITFAKKKQSIIAIQGVLDLYTRKVAGENVTTAEWAEGRKNAYAAAAYAAAAYAAAAYAADAAAAYADAAADAAAAYADADAASRITARQKYYSTMAEKIIEIISNENNSN